MLQLLVDAGLRVATMEGSDALSMAVELKLPAAVTMLAQRADCNDLRKYVGAVIPAAAAAAVRRRSEPTHYPHRHLGESLSKSW